MPSVDPQRKLAALANLDLSVEQIRHITGPNGLFTLAPGRMAASTVRDLKRRQEQFGNVLHRKRRHPCRPGHALSTDELQLLHSTFAGPDARAKTTTPELQERLIERFMAGRAARGLPGAYPASTVNDAVRAMVRATLLASRSLPRARARAAS